MIPAAVVGLALTIRVWHAMPEPANKKVIESA